MDQGGIPESIRKSSDRVAVVFTQSWCGDWHLMRRYIKKIEEPSLEVFYIEYDNKPFFEEIKSFKERVFKNGMIPYIQYFRAGELVNDSNLIWRRKGFMKRFDTRKSQISYR